MATSDTVTSSGASTGRPVREGSYHHGDLRNALVRASSELAEAGGPAAVTVRAAARAVGVTATAAYRHFKGHEELLAAVHEEAARVLFREVDGAMKAVADPGDPTTTAISHLAAIARAYIEFAIREPGLFRTAFGVDDRYIEKDIHQDPIFRLLAVNLDTLVETGFMDIRQRPGAEFTAWAAVHGLAALIVDGPLSGVAGAERDVAIRHTTATVLRGFATGPDAGPYCSTNPDIALV